VAEKKKKKKRHGANKRAEGESKRKQLDKRWYA